MLSSYGILEEPSFLSWKQVHEKVTRIKSTAMEYFMVNEILYRLHMSKKSRTFENFLHIYIQVKDTIDDRFQQEEEEGWVKFESNDPKTLPNQTMNLEIKECEFKTLHGGTEFCGM